MLRTHTNGELRIEHAGTEVTLCGWVQRSRDKGGMIWVDLRDRYGVTQLMLEEGKSSAEALALARGLGREFVVEAKGIVVERLSKNDKMPTGDIEINVLSLTILNAAKLPPFTIEDETDGGDELRMQYRYLDLRRNPVLEKLRLRNQVALETRKYLDSKEFLDVETPVLIKSTPEGARDFVVPSRMNEGQFYALPQSPQTFKQLLMVSGFDRYYQIVKCFRDEDLRADRQPEFTQIDCEMAFVEQNDILNMFEGLIKHLFETVRGVKFERGAKIGGPEQGFDPVSAKRFGPGRVSGGADDPPALRDQQASHTGKFAAGMNRGRKARRNGHGAHHQTGAGVGSIGLSGADGVCLCGGSVARGPGGDKAGDASCRLTLPACGWP